MQLDVLFGALRDSLAQMFDSRFVSVLLKAFVITFVALSIITYGLAQVTWAIIGDGFTLPWIGEVTLFTGLMSGAIITGLIAASIFVMPAVAVIVVGLFLDEIAEAVEDRHYPSVRKVEPMAISQALKDGLRFGVLFVLVNLVGLILWPFFFFLGPVWFWLINGFLISHEYFMLVAQRRLAHSQAAQFKRNHILTVLLGGVALAMVLNLPFINLFVPIIGVAIFTHLFHRLPRPAD